jgi:hypothetical protein
MIFKTWVKLTFRLHGDFDLLIKQLLTKRLQCRNSILVMTQNDEASFPFTILYFRKIRNINQVIIITTYK